MPVVKETKRAEAKIRGLRLWVRYKKQKAYFIDNPSHGSLEFIFFDKKNRICSFKITNKYRVKMTKNEDDSFTVFDAGDYHK